MGDKRPRASNFTNEEKLCCLNIIKNFKHVIESKTTGMYSWKEKESAWKDIEKEFNSQSSIYRPADVLKRFYNNKKKEVRKQAGLQKAECTKTGGGSYDGGSVETTSDPILNLTLDINKKTVFGHRNNFDCDSVAYINEVENSRIADKDSTRSNVSEEDVSEILFLPEDVGADKEKNEVNLGVGTSQSSRRSNDWSRYTPRMLKTPTSQNLKFGGSKSNSWCNRRRPNLTKTSALNQEYEEVAKLKKEAYRLQIDILKAEADNLQERELWERQQRQVNDKRAQEEHEWKRRSALLDIALKEAQLKAIQKM